MVKADYMTQFTWAEPTFTNTREGSLAFLSKVAANFG